MLLSVALGLLGELVAPTRCVACDERVSPRVLFCSACGASVAPAAPQAEGAYSVFEFDGALITSVVRFKYGGRFDLGARFGPVMAQRVTNLASDIDLVVPVPLHPLRLAERGFNQSALLGAIVARHLAVEHAPRALVRERPTSRQASLDRVARIANVASAFRCAMPWTVVARRVLLVDDVRTTGATLAACTSSLRAAGARQVLTLVLGSRDHDEIDHEKATSYA